VLSETSNMHGWLPWIRGIADGMGWSTGKRDSGAV